MKNNNIQTALKVLSHAKSVANDGERLPPIPYSKIFKTSKKDKLDNPKHKKKCEDY